MNVLRFESPADFARAATPFLLEHEAENNLLFGLLNRIDDATRATLRVVQDGGRPVAAALQTDPAHHLILSHASNDAIDVLADALAKDGVTLPGAQGSSSVAQRFTERWARSHGQLARRKMALGVYRLTRVVPPARAPQGAHHVATSDDVPAVAQYMKEFCEAIGENVDDDFDAAARRRIATSSLHLWKVNGAAVSIAAGVGPTPNGIRIGLVYTPAHLRNRGYASALVASLSQKLLDSGRTFCFLFTDLENPTSNKIYRDIGYEFVCEQHQFRFDSAGA